MYVQFKYFINSIIDCKYSLFLNKYLCLRIGHVMYECYLIIVVFVISLYYCSTLFYGIILYYLMH